MRLRLRPLLTALTTAVLLGGTLTACGGGDGADDKATTGPKSKPTSASSSPPAPPRKSFDPPVRFDAEENVGLPETLRMSPETGETRFDRASFALRAGIAYAVDGDKVIAFDTTADTTLWSTPLGTSAWPETSVPVVLELPTGGPVVIASVIEKVGGGGTSKGTYATKVAALDVRTGAPRWQQIVQASGRLVGADREAAVFAAAEEGAAEDGAKGSVWALDPATGKKLWEKKDTGLVDPVYGGGAVVGVLKSTEKFKVDGYDTTFEANFTRLAGLSPRDGSIWWERYKKSDQLKARALGGGLVQAEVEYSAVHDFGDDTVHVIDATSGEPRVRLPVEGPVKADYWACLYDERSTVVCGVKHGWERVMAYDATSGKELWALPTQDRNTLEVTAAWHGAVYGDVENGGPVVLDARTGADREVKPGVAPVRVSGNVGLVPSHQGQLDAHPAIG